MNNNRGLFINRITTQPQLNNFDVTLKEGLNIIYAQDTGGNGTVNSVGKSTFVHLINFGLGANPIFKSSTAKEKLKENFLLMEFRIGVEQFTIRRKLIPPSKQNDICEVFGGWVINDLNKGNVLESDKKDLEEYKSFLETLLFGDKNYHNSNKIISIREYIYLFLRAQGKGFENIENPMGISESAQKKRTRLEFVSGLLSDKIKELNEEIEKKEREEKDTKSEYQVIKKYIEHKVSETEIDDDNKNKNSEINAEINQLEHTYRDAESKFKNLQSYLDILRSDKEKLRQELINLESKIEIVDSRIKNYRATLNEVSQERKTLRLIDKASQWFDINFEYKSCPLCLQSIEEHEGNKCKVESENNTAIQVLSNVLDNERLELTEAIERALTQKDYLLLMREQVENKVEELNDQSNTDLDYLFASLHTTEERLRTLYQERAFLENISKLVKDIEVFKKNWEVKRKELQDKKSDLKDEKKSFDERLEQLKTNYNEVVNYLYNNTKSGVLNLSPKASNFEVSIKNKDAFNTEDTGDATNIMKVVAFDLALLKMSNDDGNMHPHFLVHDSPNVKDVDPEVYKRIILYTQNLEKEGLEFQYIITTLLLPDDMDKDSEYIRLKLNNDGDGGKLFGITF